MQIPPSFNEAALHEGRKSKDALYHTEGTLASMRPPFMKGGNKKYGVRRWKNKRLQ